MGGEDRTRQQTLEGLAAKLIGAIQRVSSGGVGMSSSASRISPPALAESAYVTDEALVVELADGRVLSAPLAWYPRLLHGTSEERANHRLMGRGEGIHWPALDERYQRRSSPSGTTICGEPALT